MILLICWQPYLANKNKGCPVKFELQINSTFLVEVDLYEEIISCDLQFKFKELCHILPGNPTLCCTYHLENTPTYLLAF